MSWLLENSRTALDGIFRNPSSLLFLRSYFPPAIEIIAPLEPPTYFFLDLSFCLSATIEYLLSSVILTFFSFSCSFLDSIFGSIFFHRGFVRVTCFVVLDDFLSVQDFLWYRVFFFCGFSWLFLIVWMCKGTILVEIAIIFWIF